MIQIMKVDEDEVNARYDHVKCPQCHTRLCGKPKGTRVHILQLSQNKMKQNPLLFTCKRCNNHYLVSLQDE